MFHCRFQKGKSCKYANMLSNSSKCVPADCREALCSDRAAALWAGCGGTAGTPLGLISPCAVLPGHSIWTDKAAVFLLQSSAHLWHHYEHREAYQKLLEDIAVLRRLAARLSSRAEMVGAVRQVRASWCLTGSWIHSFTLFQPGLGVMFTLWVLVAILTEERHLL